MRFQQLFTLTTLRARRPALGGMAAALACGAGLIGFACAPQAAQAQAASGDTYTALYPFADGGVESDGAGPTGGLVLGSNGEFYGTTSTGGASNDGTVYEVSASGSETVLYSFGGTDGKAPYGSLVLGSDGNFYGTTSLGGANGYGSLFKITATGALTVLHSFNNTGDGAFSYQGLVTGADGQFYGITTSGGAYNGGTAFKITASGAFTLLHAFDPSVGGYSPYSGFIKAQDGNFYGTTVLGGAGGVGTIFVMSPTGSVTFLYSFTGGSDGGSPYAGLVQGGDGGFYGLTRVDGANQTGTAYELSPSRAFVLLHTFSADSGSGNADGANPYEPMILGTDGKFYGTIAVGGASNTGTVFQLTATGTLTTLYSFSANGGADGNTPKSAVLETKSGALYGTTSNSGADAVGTVFSLAVPSLVASAPPIGTGQRFDFNGDGHSDLVWYNVGSGGVSIWDTNDQDVLAFGGAFSEVAPSSGWQPVASVDVNGDGLPDLIWWNSQTGEMSAWELDNDKVLSFGADFAQLADTTWRPVAVGDVTDNTVGNPPTWTLVFQNTVNGDISRWEMQGTTVIAYGGTLASLGYNSPNHIVGAPDLNGDGKSDLLFWNSQTGAVSSWSMNLAQSQILSYNGNFTQLIDTSWHLVGSEDTNGDGYSDLIWWNAVTGEVSRWLLNGTTITQYGSDTARVADTNWQPTAIR